MAQRTCKHCSADISGAHALSKYCSSRCRNRAAWERKPRATCVACGRLTGWAATAAKGREVRCKPCTRESEHGTYAMYAKRGCRCDECKAGAAARMREYAAEYKARTGRSLYSKYRKYDGAHGHFIPRHDRLAVYERDGWVCQLCGDPVDRELHYNHRFAATLDHIEPQSLALVPDHSPSNLRLAHRACNSRRNNGEVERVPS